MLEILDDLKDFIDTKTHASVLQHSKLEADDLIAGWCQTHPDDTHIILSSDSDFKQLLSPNIIIHNGVEKTTMYHDKVLLENGKPKKDKNGESVIPESAEYFLFKKIIRGDTSDNIRPSYPGVREKGTKKKVGIIEAYNDRHTKGYAWNTFMNEKWTDHEGVEHYVKDKFNHNKTLIDLSAQPDFVKNYIAETISNVYNNEKKIQMIGIQFIKFCGRYDLQNIATNSTQISNILTKRLL
jgi:5'-3' exonuclease